MDTHLMLRARQGAEASPDPQERNRLWWESMPMTYAGWEGARRELGDAAQIRRLVDDFLKYNPWLARHLDFASLSGRDVLEIGCGSGAASCRFAAHGARVTAVDLTQTAVDLATRHAAILGLPVRVQRMDAEKLDLPDASFDYVFSWGVLHHSHDTPAAFRHVARVLRPGGRGLIMVYNRRSLRFWLKGLWWLLVKGRLFRGHTIDTVQGLFTDGYYQRHFWPRELAREIRRAGLTPTRLAVSHMFKDSAGNRYVPWIPRALDEWCKRTLGFLLVVEFRKPG